MIGVVFLFLDCYEFQNVLRKLEYSDVYLAEMVRDTELPYFSWQGCAWGLLAEQQVSASHAV